MKFRYLEHEEANPLISELLVCAYDTDSKILQAHVRAEFNFPSSLRNNALSGLPDTIIIVIAGLS